MSKNSERRGRADPRVIGSSNGLVHGLPDSPEEWAEIITHEEIHGTPRRWLDGAPMDPKAGGREPLGPVPGFPFLTEGGCSAMIVGPTGKGRSWLVEAAAFDAAMAGLRVAYFGSEVTQSEFNDRAAELLKKRGHSLDDRRLLSRMASGVRYHHVMDVLPQAYGDREYGDRWRSEMPDRYEVAVLDPVSAVASALGLDFERRGPEFASFFDLLVQPLVTAGMAVVMIDNIGHGEEARGRAIGTSMKEHRPDYLFSCKSGGAGLTLKVNKRRRTRAPFVEGDKWLFEREGQTIEKMEFEGDGSGSGGDGFEPTYWMEQASKYIEANPGLGVRNLTKALGGEARMIQLALGLLESGGYVRVEMNGQKKCHFPERPYLQIEENS